jgi:hypothetical protein
MIYKIEIEYEIDTGLQQLVLTIHDSDTASLVFRALVNAPKIKRLLTTEHGTVDGVPNAWVVSSWVAV